MAFVQQSMINSPHPFHLGALGIKLLLGINNIEEQSTTFLSKAMDNPFPLY
jgi:hypothetical protein